MLFDLLTLPQLFQSPEGEVLTVQLGFVQVWYGIFRVSVPRRGSADGATMLESCSDDVSGVVSVPRRGSADGATIKYQQVAGGSAGFQSPEGEVLTVQLEPRRKRMRNRNSFQSPEGEVLTVQHYFAESNMLWESGFSPPKGKC